MKSAKKYIFYGLIVFFAAVFIFCTVQIVSYVVESNQHKDLTNDLIAMHTTSPNSGPKPTVSQPSANPTGSVEPAPTMPPMLEDMVQIYNLNAHTVGWLTIEDTHVNYPVLQTPDTREWRNWYLYRNFEGKDSKHGWLYARESCNIFAPSDNITIFGHNMNDRTMFGDLFQYGGYNFYKDHKYIQFDTLYERHTYEIFAVFRTSGTAGEGFAYHVFEDAADEAEFDEFVSTCLGLSLYKTGIVPQYGDKLLTLSTCDFHLDDGRLVVVARRLD